MTGPGGKAATMNPDHDRQTGGLSRRSPDIEGQTVITHLTHAHQRNFLLRRSRRPLTGIQHALPGSNGHRSLDTAQSGQGFGIRNTAKYFDAIARHSCHHAQRCFYLDSHADSSYESPITEAEY